MQNPSNDLITVNYTPSSSDVIRGNQRGVATEIADSDLRGYTMLMAAQRQLRALVNDRNLRRFVVQARPTGRQLGTGSYGTVEEVDSSTEI